MITEKRTYELFALISPNLLDSDLKNQQDALKAIISNHGGVLKKNELWKDRYLAYKIASHDKGTYLLAYLELATNAVKAFEADLRLEKNILRYLLLKVADDYTYTPVVLNLPKFGEKFVKEERKNDERTFAKKPDLRSVSNLEKKEPEDLKSATTVGKEDMKKEELKSDSTVEEKEKSETRKPAKKKASLEERISDLDGKLADIVNNPDIMGI
jgi:small subunit ribosomal protein S6